MTDLDFKIEPCKRCGNPTSVVCRHGAPYHVNCPCLGMVCVVTWDEMMAENAKLRAMLVELQGTITDRLCALEARHDT